MYLNRHVPGLKYVGRQWARLSSSQPNQPKKPASLPMPCHYCVLQTGQQQPASQPSQPSPGTVSTMSSPSAIHPPSNPSSQIKSNPTTPPTPPRFCAVLYLVPNPVYCLLTQRETMSHCLNACWPGPMANNIISNNNDNDNGQCHSDMYSE